MIILEHLVIILAASCPLWVESTGKEWLNLKKNVLKLPYGSIDNFIITILIEHHGFLSNLFDSFNKPIMISVGKILDNFEMSINLNDLFPLLKCLRDSFVFIFLRFILFDSLELKGISSPDRELVTAIFVEVPIFSHFYFLVILVNHQLLHKTIWLSVRSIRIYLYFIEVNRSLTKRSAH